jgi:hypothetical protein
MLNKLHRPTSTQVTHVSQVRSNRNGQQQNANLNAAAANKPSARRSKSKRRAGINPQQALGAAASGAMEHLENRTLLSVTGFQPAVSNNVSPAPRAVAVGDLNGDGKLDLVSANQTGGNVSVLLGNGNGTFQSAVNYNAGSGPRAVVLADFNGDGKLDAVVANQAGNLTILLGNGSGGFGAPVSYAAGSTPVALAVGDFNGDGKLDVAVANFAGNNVSIFTGNGNGTFNAAVNYATTNGGSGTAPDGIVAGDFNGDGKTDLATSDSGGGVSVLLNNGSGGFGAASTFAAGTSPKGIVAADFTGDGKLDLAVVNGTSNNVSLLAGDGSGSFGSATNFAVGSAPIGAVAADFNSDGKMDLAVANSSGNNLTMLYGTGSGSFNTGVNQAVGTGPEAVAAGDFNADGSIDLAAANKTSNTVSVLLDKHITVTGAPQTVDEGNALAGVRIASFSDTEAGTVAGDYAATIDWGDGVTSAGVVSANGSGGFDVAGTHTYATAGVYGVIVTVHDTLGTTAFGTTSTTVNDATLTNGNVVSVTATEGSAFTGTLANFTDGNSGAAAGDFVAIVDWGDGTSSSGSVVSDGAGTFHVTGTHTWKHNSSPTITVDVLDAGGSETLVSTAATVNDAPLTASAATPVFVEGTSATQKLATFTDANPFGSAAEFSAVITWGDGSTSAGTVTANGSGGYDVTGTHNYVHSGNKAASVAITSTGGSTATQAVTVAVNNATLTLQTQNDVSVTEGIPFSGALVATFTDANAGASAADFTATINWGDGTSSAADIIAGGGGGFYVQGDAFGHTYAHAGNHAIQVTITGAGGSVQHSTSNGFAFNQAMAANANNLTATEGTALPGTTLLGTFTDANASASAGDFTATIDWGDGSTSNATIAANGSGGFDVTGGHTYAHAGNKTLSFTVHGAGTGLTSAISSATVNNAAITTTTAAITATEGSSYNGNVAHFTDANALASATDFTASINWGDGTTTAGVITANAGGGFDVAGVHTYAEEGTPNVTVTITGAGGGTSNNTHAATVNDAALHSSGHNVTATEGTLSGTLTVASFTDDDPAGTAGDYTALIDWGDGNVSVGTIAANGQGGFDVTDSHRYLEAGDHTLSVTIDDAGGAETIATSTAHVDNAAVTPSAGSFTATEGTSASGIVASFTSANGSAPASQYAATIDWGDGTTSAGVVSDNLSGGFDVTATHTYAHAGSKPVGVTINGSYGTVATTSLTATVNNAALGATAAAFTATEGTATDSSTVVAHFTDANASAAAADFTASIAWGDGNTTAGTVVAHLGGGFDVLASHSYVHSGNKTFTVTITGAGGGTASDSATATVHNAALASTGVDISGTEGTAITAPIVASFTDANAGATAGDFAATIHWGDGTSDPAVIAANGEGGFNVTGPDHTYAHAGPKTITIDITGNGGGTTHATATATVANATLSSSANDLAATEGTALAANTLIGTFTDANASATAGDFTATVWWGDGVHTTATITANGSGGFDVTAGHTYAHAGAFPITMVIEGAGGGATGAAATARVANAAIAVTAKSFAAVEGLPMSNALMATFTDANAAATSDDFYALIAWGDGTTGTGTIAANQSGGFDVTGSHTYAHSGNKTATVTIYGKGGGVFASDQANDIQVNGSATYNNGGLQLVDGGGSEAGSAWSTNTLDVSSFHTHFTFQLPTSDADGFTFAIQNDNSQASLGAVGGGFGYRGIDHSVAVVFGLYNSVSQTGLYTNGQDPHSLPVQLGGSSIDLTASGINLHSGHTFGVTLDYDGTTLTQTVVDQVTGATFTHAYTIDIPGTIGASKARVGFTGATGGAKSVQDILDWAYTTAPHSDSHVGTVANQAISAMAVGQSAVEGTATGSSIVATFSDPNALASASDFTATIDWGDGSATDVATVASDGNGGFNVTAPAHTYLHAGGKTATVVITGAGGGTATVTPAVIVANAALNATGQAVSATEGTSTGSVLVANFTDANASASAGDFSATIDWGDGVTSAGSIASDGLGGFNVSGVHTYGHAGSKPVAVTIHGAGGGTASASSTATIANAALTASNSTFNATEGAIVTAVVGHFTDANGAAGASDFTASINWGDGTAPTAGTVVANLGGGFDIVGTHTYAEEGTYTATTTATGLGGGTAVSSYTGTVADAALSATGTNVSAIEGTNTGTILVANFTDADPNGTLADFSATIHWGDGSSSAGAIAVNGQGGWSVSGSHLYATAGSFTVTADIDDAGAATTTSTSTATVHHGVITAAANNISGTEGTAIAGTTVVASFTDTNLSATAGDFTATITWGDGSNSAGTVVANGSGGFDVQAGHTYNHAGSATFTVAVSGLGGSDSRTATATIANAALNAAGTTIGATEGVTFAGADVANFTDANAAAAAGDFTASIDWGDGTTSAGTVSANGGGSFSVLAGHSYDHAGPKTISVTINGLGGGTTSATSTANVANAALSPTDTTVSATEGTAFTGAIAGHFADVNAAASAVDFSATIHWGDGSSSAGTVVASLGGGFDVVGPSHTYAHAGPKTVTVDVTGAGGGTTTITSSATVANAALAMTGNTVTATEAASFTGAVVTFTDANAAASAGDFTAVIDWGDGSATSTGTITANGAGGFDVTGTHTFVHSGPKAPTVTVVGLGGGSIVGSGTVNVGNAALNATGQVNTAVEGTAFSGTLGSFSDANAGATLADFTGTIAWGDGVTSAAVITTKAGGGFLVSGAHTYTVPGAYSPAFTITGAGGGTVTGTSLMAVADATLNPSAVTIHATEGFAFSGQVASVQDQNHGSVIADFSATIDWGDGTTSAGTLVSLGNGLFNITGTHTWTSAGSRSVAVTLNDTGGASATVSSSAIVADAALTATGTPISTTEGLPFSGAVAHFSDANPLAIAANFSATITWGDGSTAAGTVVANAGGGFDVTGAHTYAHAGSKLLSVVINDVGGSTASAGATATVANATLNITAGTVSGTEGQTIVASVAHFTDANDQASATDFTATINWGDGTTTVAAVSDSIDGGFDILGSHTYRHAGNKNVTVTINGLGGGTVNTTLTAPIANAVLNASGKTVNATEGTSFTGTLASFTDANTFASAADFAATITWGDGSTSAGTIAAGDSAGSFVVTGTHAYDHAGDKAPVVAITGAANGSTSATATVHVANAALSATASDLSATEGTSTGTVTIGHLTDANVAADASDFTVTVNWGDGSSSAGTLVSTAPGEWDVTGSHTYAHAGTATVTLDAAGQGGGTATASSTATIANATLAATSLNLNATEGTPLASVVLAHFTDTNAAAAAADFTADIDWGDGTPHGTGTIVANPNGGFDVKGTHAYPNAGDKYVTVSINGAGGGFASTFFTLHVHNAAITVTGKTLTSVEGSEFNGVVGTFTDANAQTTADFFMARIDWGDGTNGIGVVTANNSGGYDVTANHTYATQGTRTVTVEIEGAGGSIVDATSTMHVTDAAITGTGATTLSAVEGSPLTAGTVLASFTDADTLDGPSSLSASINWGDGSAAAAGTLVQTGPGTYDVTGPAHTWLHAGNKTVTVTLSDVGGSSSVATAALSVTNASLNAAMNAISATEGVQYTGKVGHFSDANGSAAAGDFTATITWGDGSTSQGTITAAAGGGFDVSSGHKWTSGGSKAVGITITGAGGGNAHASGNVAVALKPFKATGIAVTAFQGTSFTANIASVVDQNTSSDATDFTATITWGDGTSSTGTVTRTAAGKFLVAATHTYANTGRFTAQVSIVASDGGTAAAKAIITVKKPKVGKKHHNGGGKGGSGGTPGVGSGNGGSGSTGNGGHHVGGGNGNGNGNGSSSDAPTGGAWTKPQQLDHLG